MGLYRTLSYMAKHPLNRGRPVRALARFVRWQVGSRLLGTKVAVPFVGDTRLLVSRGMHGATGNIYCGLHEFEDMSLVFHMLKPGELFFDIGANVGTFSVLASGVACARSICFEPAPENV